MCEKEQFEQILKMLQKVPTVIVLMEGCPRIVGKITQL